MKLTHLKYFKALAESEHLNNTALELYLSPSALSTSIHSLEAEVGVQLFDRVGRNIKLNKNGKKFYQHVKRVLNELDIAREELKQSKRVQKTLSIAVSTHVLWERPITEFMNQNPDIIMNVVSMSFDRISSYKYTEPFDLIITAFSDVNVEEYEYAVLIPDDKPVLVVYPDHSFANKKTISLIEAKNEPFVALSPNYSSRHFFDVMCELAGFTPKIVAVGDYSLRARIVNNRKAIAFSTVSGSKSPMLSGLKFVEVSEPHQPRVQTIFWKMTDELSVEAEKFRTFMIQYYQNKMKL